MGTARPARATAPGKTTTIPVSVTVPGPVVGKRLLAVIDADRRLDDIDRPNNTDSKLLTK